MKKLFLSLALYILTMGIVKANILQSLSASMKINKCTVLTQNVASTTIPFTLKDGRIIIEVAVNNEGKKTTKEKFYLDTGAPTLFVDDYVKNTGMPLEPVKLGATSALKQKGEEAENHITVKPVIFTIGDMQVQYGHVLVLNAKIQDMKCNGISGLIGSSLLSKFIVTFNFKDSTLTLSDKNTPISIPAFDHKLHFSKNIGGSPYFDDISVNGTETFTVWDTGYPGSMVMQFPGSKVEKMNPIINNTATKTFETYAAVGDVNGLVKEKAFMYVWQDGHFKNNNDSIAVNGITAMTNAKQHEIKSNIGVAFMSQYDSMVIDWNSKHIYLIGTRKTKPLPGQDISLRYLKEEKKYVVAAINTKCSLYQQGLHAGDEIQVVNGQQLPDPDKTNECDINRQINKLNTEIRSVSVNRNGASVNIGQ